MLRSEQEIQREVELISLRLSEEQERHRTQGGRSFIIGELATIRAGLLWVLGDNHAYHSHVSTEQRINAMREHRRGNG